MPLNEWNKQKFMLSRHNFCAVFLARICDTPIVPIQYCITTFDAWRHSDVTILDQLNKFHLYIPCLRYCDITVTSLCYPKLTHSSKAARWSFDWWCFSLITIILWQSLQNKYCNGLHRQYGCSSHFPQCLEAIHKNPLNPRTRVARSPTAIRHLCTRCYSFYRLRTKQSKSESNSPACELNSFTCTIRSVVFMSFALHRHYVVTYFTFDNIVIVRRRPLYYNFGRTVSLGV